MSKNVQLSYDESKLKALNQYMDKKQIALQDEIEGFIDKLYEKYVPVQVREFIDNIEKDKGNKKAKISKKQKNEIIENTTNYE